MQSLRMEAMEEGDFSRCVSSSVLSDLPSPWDAGYVWREDISDASCLKEKVDFLQEYQGYVYVWEVSFGCTNIFFFK